MRKGEQDEEVDKHDQRCRQAPRAARCTSLLLLLLTTDECVLSVPPCVSRLRVFLYYYSTERVVRP